MNWSLSGNESGVSVVRWTGSTWAIIATLPAGTQSFIDTGLSPNTIYYYDVIAFNEAGTTWATNYAAALTLAGVRKVSFRFCAVRAMSLW